MLSSTHVRPSVNRTAVSLFVNMDKLIGKDFETGLAGLKAVVGG